MGRRIIENRKNIILILFITVNEEIALQSQKYLPNFW